MSIEFKELTPAPEVPKAKKIIIGGIECGEVKPHFYGDTLSWHASIKAHCGILVSLIQGHGPSPRAAVADAILTARRDRDAFIEKFAWLEKELGTAGKSDEEIKRDVI